MTHTAAETVRTRRRRRLQIVDCRFLVAGSRERWRRRRLPRENDGVKRDGAVRGLNVEQEAA